MKKLLALLLVLAMVFSMMAMLTACGDADDDDEKTSSKDDDDDDDKKNDDEEDDDKKDNEDDEEDDGEFDIVGEWVGTVDMAELLNMMLEAQEMDMLAVDEFEVRITFIFDENGEYSMEFNSKDITTAMDKCIPVWADALEEYLEEEGASAEEFEDEYGMTIEEYLEEYYAEMLDSDSMGGDGDYELKNNKLQLDGQDGKFVLETGKNKFEFTDYTGDDDNGLFEMLFAGVVFKRQ